MANIRKPENGTGRIKFMESYWDELSGILLKRDEVELDLDRRIRMRGDSDRPNRGHLLRTYGAAGRPRPFHEP